MKFNTQWNHPGPSVICKATEGVTVQQHMASEVDINSIISKAKLTGVLPPGKIGFYADFASETSLQQAYELVDHAEDYFAALPAAVRARFQNDPLELLAFVGDKKNREEAEKLGLLQPADKPADKPAEKLAEKPAEA